jgi:hypothetical protein
VTNSSSTSSFFFALVAITIVSTVGDKLEKKTLFDGGVVRAGMYKNIKGPQAEDPTSSGARW